MTPSDFGQVALIQTSVLLLTGVATLGFTVSIAGELARTRSGDAEAAGRIFGTGLFTGGIAALAMGLLYCIGLLGYAGTLGTGGPGTGLILFGAVGIAFSADSALLQAGLLGFERFTLYAVAQALQAVATSACVVLGAVAADATGAVAGLAVGLAATAVGSGLLLRRVAAEEAVPALVSFHREAWRRLWRVGRLAMVGSALVSGSLLVAQLILSATDDGFTEVAIFNVAYRWHLAILLIPASIAPSLLPVMARLLAQRRPAETKRLFRFNLVLHAGISGVLAAGVVVAAPAILRLHGSFYAHDTLPLVVMAAAAVPSALNNVLSSAGLSYGLIRAWFVSDCVLAGTLVIGGLLSMPDSGAAGLAVAYAAAFAATDAVLLVPLRASIRSAEARSL